MRTISGGGLRWVVLVGTMFVVAAACSNGSDPEPRGAPSANQPSTTTRPPGDPPPDPNTTVTVFAPLEMRKVLEQLAVAFSEAHPGLAVEPILGTSAALLERAQSGEESGVYIDDQAFVARLGGRRAQGEPVPFGENRLHLVVKRGNPKRIQGLSVFGAHPQTVSAVCSEEVPCGVLGQEVLEAAGVVAVPDRVGVDGRELVRQVAEGQIDAALLFRSDIHSRLRKTTVIAELNVVVEYQLVRFGRGAAADKFAEFLQSDEAQLVLKRRGFVPLF